MLSNPPFGVEWKKVEKQIKNEYEENGFEGRFGAGLPRISDGSLLFLQHMISKMKPSNSGSRIGIVFIVTNRKPKERKGKVQLINAISFYNKMKKSLGNKRNEIGKNHIEEITNI